MVNRHNLYTALFAAFHKAEGSEVPVFRKPPTCVSKCA